MQKANRSVRTGQQGKKSARPEPAQEDLKSAFHKIAGCVEDVVDVTASLLGHLTLTDRERKLTAEFMRVGQAFAQEIRHSQPRLAPQSKKEA